MPNSGTASAQITKGWEKALAAVVLPVGAATGFPQSLPAYSEQPSGTPDRSYVLVYGEGDRVSPVRGSTDGMGREFRSQFAEFASTTERNLSFLQSRVADLSAQVNQLARTATGDIDAPGGDFSALPTSDEDWATLFHFSADEGREPVSGIALKAAEVLSSDRTDALLIAAARAIAVLDKGSAKKRINQARKRVTNAKIASRLKVVVQDYGL